MTHHLSALLLFAANWGFAAWGIVSLGLILASVLGWMLRGVWEAGEDVAVARKEFQANVRASLERAAIPMLCFYCGHGEHHLCRRGDCSCDLCKTQLAETSVQRKTPDLPQNRPWQKNYGGEIPYEELEGMFLDQFLLRWFWKLMPTVHDLEMANFRQPWQNFEACCPWVKQMPLLFEQLTGYKLNDLQLNNAIAEYVRRLNAPRPATPVQGETNKAPEYTGI